MVFGATAGGGYLPRLAGMRARGQWTRSDPTELPRRLDVGKGRMTSGDFLAAGQTDKTQEQIKTFQKKRTKQNEVNGRRILLSVWSSVTVHTAGRNKDTRTRT